MDISGVTKVARKAIKLKYCGAVIVAVGAQPRLLGVPGETEYTGHGVSYCATCDGALYQGKPVVVVGSGNTAKHDKGKRQCFIGV